MVNINKKLISLLFALSIMFSAVPVLAETDDDTGIEGYRTECEKNGGTFVIHFNDGEFAHHECIDEDGDSIDCWTNVPVPGETSCEIYIDEEEDTSEIFVDEPIEDKSIFTMYLPVAGDQLAVARAGDKPTAGIPKGLFEAACISNGGKFITLKDGGWACDYPTGDDIICDSEGCYEGWIVERWIKDFAESITKFDNGDIVAPVETKSNIFGPNSIFGVNGVFGPNSLIVSKPEFEVDCVIKKDGIFDGQGFPSDLCSENLSGLVTGQIPVTIVGIEGPIDTDCSMINIYVGTDGADVRGLSSCRVDQNGILAAYTPISVVGINDTRRSNCTFGVFENNGNMEATCVTNADEYAQIIDTHGFFAMAGPDSAIVPHEAIGIMKNIQQRDILPNNNNDPSKCIPSYVGCEPDSPIGPGLTLALWFGILATTPIVTLGSLLRMRNRINLETIIDGSSNTYTPINIISSLGIGIVFTLASWFAVRGLTGAGILNLAKVPISGNLVLLPYPSEELLNEINLSFNFASNNNINNGEPKAIELFDCTSAENESPIPLSPQNTHTGLLPKFEWSSPLECEVLGYQLQVGEYLSPPWTNTLDSEVGNTKSHQLTNELLRATVYRWRVLVLLEPGSANISDFMDFVTGPVCSDVSELQAPVIISPQNNSSTSGKYPGSGELKLEWSYSSGSCLPKGFYNLITDNPEFTGTNYAGLTGHPGSVESAIPGSIIYFDDQTLDVPNCTNLFMKSWGALGDSVEISGGFGNKGPESESITFFVDLDGDCDLETPTPTPIIGAITDPIPTNTFTPTVTSINPTITPTASPTDTPTPSPTPIPPDPNNASISGFAWNDQNGDGNKDGGEGTLPQTSIKIGTGSCSSTGLNSASTGFTGAYSFTGLAAGTYCVSAERFSLPDEHITPEFVTIVLSASQSATVNFGFAIVID